MPHPIRGLVASLLLVVIPAALAFAWGLSWALGDYPECASGNYALAPLGWALQGIALGLIVGVVVPVILLALRAFLLAIPVVFAAGVGMLWAGNAGATIAAPLVGCTAWDVRGAGEVILLGLAAGAVPTIVLAGLVVGLRALLREPPPSPRDDVRPPADPAS